MEIETNERGEKILSGVFNGIGIQTDVGIFYIAQRDSGIEIRLGDGPWYAWTDATGPKLPEGDTGTVSFGEINGTTMAQVTGKFGKKEVFPVFADTEDKYTE